MGDIYHNIITSEINDLVRQQIRITEGQGWRLFSQFMAIISEGLGVLSDLFVQNSSKQICFHREHSHLVTVTNIHMSILHKDGISCESSQFKTLRDQVLLSSFMDAKRCSFLHSCKGAATFHLFF